MKLLQHLSNKDFEYEDSYAGWIAKTKISLHKGCQYYIFNQLQDVFFGGRLEVTANGKLLHNMRDFEMYGFQIRADELYIEPMNETDSIDVHIYEIPENSKQQFIEDITKSKDEIISSLQKDVEHLKELLDRPGEFGAKYGYEQIERLMK